MQIPFCKSDFSASRLTVCSITIGIVYLTCLSALVDSERIYYPSPYYYELPVTGASASASASASGSASAAAASFASSRVGHPIVGGYTTRQRKPKWASGFGNSFKAKARNLSTRLFHDNPNYSRNFLQNHAHYTEQYTRTYSAARGGGGILHQATTTYFEPVRRKSSRRKLKSPVRRHRNKPDKTRPPPSNPAPAVDHLIHQSEPVYQDEISPSVEFEHGAGSAAAAASTSSNSVSEFSRLSENVQKQSFRSEAINGHETSEEIEQRSRLDRNYSDLVGGVEEAQTLRGDDLPASIESKLDDIGEIREGDIEAAEAAQNVFPDQLVEGPEGQSSNLHREIPDLPPAANPADLDRLPETGRDVGEVEHLPSPHDEPDAHESRLEDLQPIHADATVPEGTEISVPHEEEEEAVLDYTNRHSEEGSTVPEHEGPATTPQTDKPSGSESTTRPYELLNMAKNESDSRQHIADELEGSEDIYTDLVTDSDKQDISSESAHPKISPDVDEAERRPKGEDKPMENDEKGVDGGKSIDDDTKPEPGDEPVEDDKHSTKEEEPIEGEESPSNESDKNLPDNNGNDDGGHTLVDDNNKSSDEEKNVEDDKEATNEDAQLENDVEPGAQVDAFSECHAGAKSNSPDNPTNPEASNSKESAGDADSKNKEATGAETEVSDTDVSSEAMKSEESVDQGPLAPPLVDDGKESNAEGVGDHVPDPERPKAAAESSEALTDPQDGKNEAPSQHENDGGEESQSGQADDSAAPSQDSEVPENPAGPNAEALDTPKEENPVESGEKTNAVEPSDNSPMSPAQDDTQSKEQQADLSSSAAPENSTEGARAEKRNRRKNRKSKNKSANEGDKSNLSIEEIRELQNRKKSKKTTAVTEETEEENSEKISRKLSAENSEKIGGRKRSGKKHRRRKNHERGKGTENSSADYAKQKRDDRSKLAIENQDNMGSAGSSNRPEEVAPPSDDAPESPVENADQSEDNKETAQGSNPSAPESSDQAAPDSNEPEMDSDTDDSPPTIPDKPSRRYSYLRNGKIFRSTSDISDMLMKHIGKYNDTPDEESKPAVKAEPNDDKENVSPTSDEIKAELANMPLPPMLDDSSLVKSEERRYGAGKTNTNRNRVTKLNHRMSIKDEDWTPKRELKTKEEGANVAGDDEESSNKKKKRIFQEKSLPLARKLSKDIDRMDQLLASAKSNGKIKPISYKNVHKKVKVVKN